jgi:flagellar protein FlaF
MKPSSAPYASKAYANVSKEIAGPRELEARLLLIAAAKLQAVQDYWCDKPPGLSDAVLYNRRLWIVFIDAVMREDNKLPAAVRQNILNVGVFVMAETFSLMTKPRPEHLANLIRINRGIAAGLQGKPKTSLAFAHDFAGPRILTTGAKSAV